MSDSKITQLSAVTTLAATDILPVVTSPASSPLNKKIAFSDFQTLILAGVTNTSIKAEDSGTPRSGALEIKAGTNITISDASGVFTIAGVPCVTSLKAEDAGTPRTGALEIKAGTGITITDVSGVFTITGQTAGITALTGDVTASGSGSVAATIAPGKVTPTKISAVATDDFTFPRDVTIGRNILLPQNANIDWAANFPSEDGVRLTVLGSTLTMHNIHYNLDTFQFGLDSSVFTCNASLKVGAAGTLNVQNNGYASAVMSADSTTQGFLPPRMTTTQRNAISAPAEGLIIYNTTTHKLNVFTTTWEAITSA